jgi:hypothetical protein
MLPANKDTETDMRKNREPQVLLLTLSHCKIYKLKIKPQPFPKDFNSKAQKKMIPSLQQQMLSVVSHL